MESSKGDFLEISDLSKSYGTDPVLRGIKLSVKEGSCLALLGESGSGKTTLLKAISGFEEINGGKIELNGRVLVSDSIFVKPESRNVGLIFQDYALFPHLSVEKNVLFGWRNGEKSNIENFLIKFGLLDLKNQKPGQLSGGQQQRVAIARAIANKPSLLLLDEPFSNLDQSLRANIRDEVKKIVVQENITSIIVTHDPEDAMKVADEIAILQNGRLIQKGTPEKLYNSPVNLYVAQLMGDAFLWDDKIIRPDDISLENTEYTSVVGTCGFENGRYKVSFKHGEQVLRAFSSVKLEIGDSINWGLCN